MNIFDRNLLNLTITTLLSTLAAATAHAEPATQSVAPSFKAQDRDGDGTLSREEFVAGHGDEKAFRAADADGDNRLSSEEFARTSVAQTRP